MFGYRLALVSLAAVHLLGICDAFAIGPAAALLRPNALSAQSMPLRAPRVQGAGGRAAVCGALQMAAAKSVSAPRHSASLRSWSNLSPTAALW